jgi:hypothetical protein
MVRQISAIKKIKRLQQQHTKIFKPAIAGFFITSNNVIVVQQHLFFILFCVFALNGSCKDAKAQKEKTLWTLCLCEKAIKSN